MLKQVIEQNSWRNVSKTHQGKYEFIIKKLSFSDSTKLSEIYEYQMVRWIKSEIIHTASLSCHKNILWEKTFFDLPLWVKQFLTFHIL